METTQEQNVPSVESNETIHTREALEKEAIEELAAVYRTLPERVEEALRERFSA